MNKLKKKWFMLQMYICMLILIFFILLLYIPAWWLGHDTSVVFFVIYPMIFRQLVCGFHNISVVFWDPCEPLRPFSSSFPCLPYLGGRTKALYQIVLFLVVVGVSLDSWTWTYIATFDLPHWQPGGDRRLPVPFSSFLPSGPWSLYLRRWSMNLSQYQIPCYEGETSNIY